MLKTRVITAVIGFIIALGAITFGGLVYDVLITLLAFVLKLLFACYIMS